MKNSYFNLIFGIFKKSEDSNTKIISEDNEIIYDRLRKQYDDSLVMWLGAYISSINYMFIMKKTLQKYPTHLESYNIQLEKCKVIWSGIRLCTFAHIYQEEKNIKYKSNKIKDSVLKDIGIVF